MSPLTTIYCQISAHNLAFCTHLLRNLEDIDSKFSLRIQKEQWKKHPKFTVLLHKVFLALVGRYPCWPKPSIKNHTE